MTLYPLRDTIGNNGTSFQTLATLNVTASTSPATLTPAVPVVTGSPKAGYTLTAAPGTWSPRPSRSATSGTAPESPSQAPQPPPTN
ncbi:hypothetical protein ACW0JT_12900 [Arthrobacter sp. SA17]